MKTSSLFIVTLLLGITCSVNAQNGTTSATYTTAAATTTTADVTTSNTTSTTAVSTAASNTSLSENYDTNTTIDGSTYAPETNLTANTSEATTAATTTATTTVATTTAATTTTYESTTGIVDGSGDETTTPEITTKPPTTPVVTTSPTTTPEITTSETTSTALEPTTSTAAPTTNYQPPTTQFPTTTGATTTTETTTTAKTTTATAAAASNSDTVLAVCLTFFIIVLIVFAIVLYFYCTGKDLPCMKGKGPETEIITNDMNMRVKAANQPKFAVGHMYINEEDFESQYKRKTADDARGFREEYRAVQTEGGTMSLAKDPINVPKNRYENVLPWDSSRVVLSVPPNGDPTTDYINGNFVPGYLQEKKFIACQGPKKETCADFWRMVWEQKCATIVMTTNLVEAGKLKCDQYWPGDDNSEGASAKYGEFVVTVADVKIRNFYVMRTFKLQQYDYPPVIVRQLHYTAWPDFGVPKNPHELLLFRRRVIAANPPHSGPIIVHCSAGVGRTGTYILIDASLEQLRAEGKVDLFSFLTKMRKYRMMLVQTDAQYAFAHSAILHHIKYGETEVSVKKFRAQVQSLRETPEDAETDLLDVLFSTLLKVPQNKENMKHGRQSIKKNRVLQIIPFDDNRVTLPLKPGQDKSDYINASFIDGFKEKRAYIATQGPLEETAGDFWSMIWVYQVPNIVMLTAIVEKGQPQCAQYWPDEINKEQTYGDITVKMVGKDDDDVVDYKVREFVLSMPGTSEDERKVRQFHYTGWPEVGLPTDAHGMIEIANRLSGKDKDGYPRPTVVHCSSGGGRTGVFIALTVLMEQSDSEGMVDVFQTVKSLRAQRPHIIQTQEQFYFCYGSLLQYLETNQMADDSTTLTSNLNLSVENHSQSASPSNGTVPNHTPKGSMNNKLDLNSFNDQDGVVVEMKVPEEEEVDDVTDSPNIPEDSPTVLNIESQSSETQSGDSVNQALLQKPADEKSESNSSSSDSSNSEFEVVNETNKDAEVKV